MEEEKNTSTCLIIDEWTINCDWLLKLKLDLLIGYLFNLIIQWRHMIVDLFAYISIGCISIDGCA